MTIHHHDKENKNRYKDKKTNDALIKTNNSELREGCWKICKFG